MSTFQLDKAIFNPALYQRLRKVWFEGADLDAKDVNAKVAMRWFNASPEDRIAFDDVCRATVGHALEAIGPDRFPNPTADPFLREIQDASQADPEGDGTGGAWAALGLILLLDQIPRNIFRTNEGLAKIYNHYDKISYSLARSILGPNAPVARPDLHPQWRTSVPYRMWFYLPLLHSEDLRGHDMFDGLVEGFGEDLAKAGPSESMQAFYQKLVDSEKDHRSILDKFGRYPHRNVALGRETTPEEQNFMDGGGATFGVAQDKA